MAARDKSKRTRHLRIRERLFPNVKVFEPKRWYVPLPWVYRKVLHVLKPRQWQILTWLMMQTQREWLCELRLGELAEDIGFRSTNKLRTHIHELCELGFIKTARYDKAGTGVEYVVVVDPHEVARSLLTHHRMSPAAKNRLEDFLEWIDELPRPSSKGEEPPQEDGDGAEGGTAS